MKNLVNSVWNDDSAQDLVEYAMIAALISLACVLALGAVGTQVKTVFQDITTKLGG